MDFKELLLRQRKWIPQVKVLGLDPGETTGVAILDNGVLNNVEQLNTKDLNESVGILTRAIELYRPDYIVAEDYKVYSWKKDEHTWAALHTPQLLGVIRTLAVQQNIPLEWRMAVHAKTFCTDAKLTEWGFYKTGFRHGRDAVRHSCFSYLFSKHPIFLKGGSV